MHEDDKKAILKQVTMNGLKARLIDRLESIGAMRHENFDTSGELREALISIKKYVKSLNITIELIEEEMEE